MFEYIRGKIVAKSPTHLVVEANGIGYFLNITFNAYDHFRTLEEATVLVYLQIKEESHSLWGFLDETERSVFLHLISISGIGSNTARLILSGMTAEECRMAILTDNELAFRQVKGVGPKTAKRVIMELRDKMAKSGTGTAAEIVAGPKAEFVEAAISALVTLGFNKAHAEKALQQIIREKGKDQTTESLVRHALQILSA